MGNNIHSSTGSNLCSRSPLDISQYSNVGQNAKSWSGRYFILEEPNENKRVIKKSLFFSNHKSLNQFMQKYKAQSFMQFYLINPLYVQIPQSHSMCKQSNIINMYFPPFLPTLQSKVQKKNKQRPGLPQTQIWFIINQITHCLSVLHQQRNRPHLHLSPMTIYYNKNQNWFLHDMGHWHGENLYNYWFQNLWRCRGGKARYRDGGKWQTQKDQVGHQPGLVSNYMELMSLNDKFSQGNFDVRVAYDEDIYCFGYVILYMMTGIQPVAAKQNLQTILQYLQQTTNQFPTPQPTYSRKLFYLVKSMIQQHPDKRLNLQKLKHKLKVTQEQVLRTQIEQYRRANGFDLNLFGGGAQSENGEGVQGGGGWGDRVAGVRGFGDGGGDVRGGGRLEGNLLVNLSDRNITFNPGPYYIQPHMQQRTTVIRLTSQPSTKPTFLTAPTLTNPQRTRTGTNYTQTQPQTPNHLLFEHTRPQTQTRTQLQMQENRRRLLFYSPPQTRLQTERVMMVRSPQHGNFVGRLGGWK